METAKPNFTQIPNIIIDDWMMHLSGTAFKIVSIIARQTYGWILDESTGRRKESDWISYSQFCERTGLKNDAIAKALRELEDDGYVAITDSKGMSIDKDQRNGRKLYYRILNRTIPVSGEVIKKENDEPLRFPGVTSPETGETKENIQNKTLYNTNVLYKGDSPPSVKTTFGNPDINEGIVLLRESGNTTKELMNRYSLKRLYQRYGKEKTLKVFRWAMVIRNKPYAPAVFNYMDLEEKWPSLEAYAVRQTQKDPTKKGVVDARGL